MKKVSFWLLTAVAVAGMATATTSCGDDNDGGNTDGSKVDPSTIASANLIAYFPFEGDGKDVVGNLTPSSTGTGITYPAGQCGKSYKGAEAGYLLYDLPASSKIKTLKAFSISLWAKMVPNTTATTDAPEQMLFQVDGKGDWIWGNLFFLQHRNWPESETDKDKNFAEMDCYFWKDDAIAWKGQRGSGWFQNVQNNQWVHIICTYDNVASEFHAYVNGTLITAFDGTEYQGIKRWQEESADNSNAAPLGDLKFNAPEHLAIGAWANKALGTDLVEDAWASSFKGQLDELRFYDKGLTAAEVAELYAAEQSQIEE
ncbi:MAG: LamG domain-containing protein [Prevotellaceae bacterium]|jgi:hypothetical protein|nr:LamG domain-containing protein [Prevotellaceae bacterium]